MAARSTYDLMASAARAAANSAAGQEVGAAWQHLGRVEDLAGEAKRDLVAQLRGEGASWAAVAATTGDPKPTLHRRYGVVDDGTHLVVQDDPVLNEAWGSVEVPVQRPAGRSWLDEARAEHRRRLAEA